MDCRVKPAKAASCSPSPLQLHAAAHWQFLPFRQHILIGAVDFGYFSVAEAAKFQSWTGEPASQPLTQHRRVFPMTLFDGVVENAHHGFGLVERRGVDLQQASGPLARLRLPAPADITHRLEYRAGGDT